MPCQDLGLCFGKDSDLSGGSSFYWQVAEGYFWQYPYKAEWAQAYPFFFPLAGEITLGIGCVCHQYVS